MRHAHHAEFAVAAAVSPPTGDDPITADLRSFAIEVGITGASAMSKDELIEGLRQFHVLQKALEKATREATRR